MGLAKRAARKLKRTLQPSNARMPQATVASNQAPARVLVKQLVLPESDLGKGPEETSISELDRTSLLGRYALPPLARMSADDHQKFTDNLLSLQRMEILGVDKERLEFPESQYKTINNSVLKSLSELRDKPVIAFDGNTASELSAFLQKHQGSIVEITSSELSLDETILMPGKTHLRANGAKLIAKNCDIEKAVLLDSVSDCSVEGLVIESCSKYGIYVKKSSCFSIVNNRIANLPYKGIVAMGACETFIISNNQLTRMGNGGIFLNGNIHNGSIEGNVIDGNRGTGNLSGGIVLSSMKTSELDTAFVPWQAWNLTDLTECPHCIVIANNRVTRGRSNGAYSHAGFCNYYVGNHFEQNNKEGMCLDFGSCGCYIAYNIFKGNGGRLNMTQQELDEDFIAHAGLMEDGSSPLKVPGLSLDNAAYNIIYQNIVAENYGSGIKMVRSGVRNVILCNEITDNNVGQNERGHFFGVELASDFKPDYESGEIRELDFTPCFENIIARNTISGEHHSGIYLGTDAYINDAFDNTIMGAKIPIEEVSGKLNAKANNAVA